MFCCPDSVHGERATASDTGPGGQRAEGNVWKYMRMDIVVYNIRICVLRMSACVIYMYIHVHVSVCVYACMYVCVYAYMDVHVHVYARM